MSCWRSLFLIACANAYFTLAARLSRQHDHLRSNESAASMEVKHNPVAVMHALIKTYALSTGTWRPDIVECAKRRKPISLKAQGFPSCRVDALQKINMKLAPLRKRLGTTEKTVPLLFAFDQNLKKEAASKSGSSFIPASEKTSEDGRQWMLKSESVEIERLLEQFSETYVNRIAHFEDDTCLRSQMTRVALAFRLDCGKGNVGIWIMMDNIHPKPPDLSVPYVKFDLKHSRELGRCHRYDEEGEYKGLPYVLAGSQQSPVKDDLRMGFLGDFLSEFQDSITWSLSKGNPNQTEAKRKHMCWLRAVHMDALVLKSERLVDYSILAFVQPYDERIADKSNVFDIGPYQWSSALNPIRLHLVMGVIDLFKQLIVEEKWTWTSADGDRYPVDKMDGGREQF